MTQEDKDLLLKDLCARLPYWVICKVEHKDAEGWKTENMLLSGIFNDKAYFIDGKGSTYSNDYFPYLRPMSSMIEEEYIEYSSIEAQCLYDDGKLISDGKGIDYLNSHHFDYKGLIEKGLAIEAPEGMYNLKH